MKNVYIIKDTLGGYAHSGSIVFIAKDLNDKSKGTEYMYYSCKWANRGTSRKENAEKTIEKLRELRDLIGFENLDWEIIFVSDHKDLDFRYIQLPEEERKKQSEYCMLTRDIPKGKKTAYQKAVKDIYKKYAC